ncbi:hypothetical protein [Clostridium mediterraneense]|uniref:hypothetical protein n=1 Tax=Clostridium mediterraneense TaxID=1805472 RepID=UPI0008359875|nr:hypothetical protein [Clostridium mediterraneense]
MIEIKKKELLDEVEYEDYDTNVAVLTIDEKEELGLIKTCCGTKASECPKHNGSGSCCGKKRR